MSNELDVQNEWEENTHTHTHMFSDVGPGKDFKEKSERIFVAIWIPVGLSSGLSP